MDPDPCNLYQHTCGVLLSPRHFSAAMRRRRSYPQAGNHRVLRQLDRDYQVPLAWMQKGCELLALQPGVDRCYEASAL